MSRTLFPIIQPMAARQATELPMCREVKWDYGRGCPVFRNGAPELVEGLEAVRVWAWLALNTSRFRHEIFSWAYGSELEGLIGQPYTEALKQSEGRRYVQETLAPNPYITSVDNVEVAFSDGKLDLSCAVSTLYGKMEVRTRV